MIGPKATYSFLLIILFNVFIANGQGCQNPLKLKDLEGQWYIQYSNFPMWLKGDKTSPRFNYTIESDRLLDKVQYIKQGRKKTITGFDTSLDVCNRRFEWRGKGLLHLLRSRWEIIENHRKEKWALIYFEKTLFTPEGYDVISKNKELTKDQLNSIRAKISQLTLEKELVSIPHFDNP
ncbi:hypothetical protein [Jiulongibacter sediminis]|uniref:hypothetical protein n=1 Tax=Jiulongibacter sediminis TaxID=1605367 RepID=UPI0026ED95F1|nr:hypothetical protein [Jiulongibacter sediminis]